MAKKRRQAKIPTPAWERSRGAIGSRVMGRSFQFYGLVIIIMIAGAALGVIGYGVINDELEKRARPGSTAIQVEDTRFRVDYFASRLKIYVDQNGGPGAFQAGNAAATAVTAVSDILTQEEVVRRFAGELDITATDDEIREEIANRLGITADDESFDVVYEQELARSGLSDADYRDMIKAAVLTSKLTEKFTEDLPESAESVHYRQIAVSEQTDAEDLKREIEGGADFAELAAANSLDPATKDTGGDVGWMPRGVLDADFEEQVFALEPGEVVVIPIGAGSFVIEMMEKAEDRAIEESQIAPLASRALDSWVRKKQEPLSIVNNMDLGDGDAKKIEWAVKRAFRS